MRNQIHFLGLLAALCLCTNLQAQTYFPGKIIRAAGATDLKANSGTPTFAFPSAATAVTGATILNPDGDANNSIVASTSPSYPAFTSGNDVAGSEISYKPIVPYSVEPYGDLRRGPSHMFSDFVPGVDNASYYMYYRGTAGTEALQFRIRLGSVTSGAKGYSILLDTDGKFGATGTEADPNYKAATTGVNGNPGFEIEIDLFTQTTGQTGIAIYNVDGIDNPTTPVWSATNWLDYSQISLAATSDNGDPDFFLDFFVPFAKLGVTTATNLRAVATTVMATSPAIGGPKSDIYGLADGSYKDPNAQYAAFINAQPTFTSATLGLANTTSPTSALCTAPPVVTTVTAGSGNGQVQGTWTPSTLTGALTTADITVYKTQNGVTTTLGTVLGVNTNNPWILQNLTIASGDVITAKAKGATESMCLTSNSLRATTCANLSTRPAEPVLACGNAGTFVPKGITGTNKTTGWTVWVSNESRAQVDNSVNNASNTGAVFGTETGTSPNIQWMYSSGCSGGSNMNSGSYRIWYTDANGCQSDPVLVCQAGNGGSAMANTTYFLVAPVITSPAAITAGTKVISGTASAGSTVYMFVNGVQVASTTVSGTLSSANVTSRTTGSFTFSSGLNFANDDVVVFSSEYNTGNFATSYCGARGATKYTVGCSVQAPIISTNSADQVNIGAAITGVSSEAAGSTIKLYNSSNSLLATTTVQSNGSWTTSIVAVAGTTYYATCTVGSCVSAASANVSAATGVTNTNRCGSISTNVPSGNITSSTTSITVAYNNATNLKVTLYEDGQSVISQSGLTGSSTYTFDVTSKLYAGNGSTTGILTIGVQESGQEEVICSNNYLVQPSCTSPTAPAVSPSNAQSVTAGNTLTYTIQSPTSGVFYTISDQSTGKELASGVWAANTTDFTMTTQPISANTVAVVKAVQMASSGEVCLAATTRTITVLPITILEFTGKKAGTSNVLNWGSSLEVSASHFEVEQSTDGNVFKKIGTVAANGGGTMYSFTDITPANGVNFYRLKLVDMDGRYTYSKVVMLNDGAAGFVVTKVQPNPFKTDVSLSVYLPSPQTVSITLFDATGKQVEAKMVKGAQGSNVINLSDLQSLSQGVYMLRIVTQSGMQQYKLLKD